MGDANEFRGRIGRYRSDSEAWWPEPEHAVEGSPNVVVIVLDDVGFAQLGCFGSDLDTPTLDGVAARGLRFTNFHTTALCSPTRASLLTGRNHHAVGMGRITDLATGFPGYDGRIPRSAGFLPEMLVPAGYAAFAVGKWHLTPEEDTHLGAPRSSWPTGRGFERFYGYFGGETNQFEPALVHDGHRVPPPASWEDGYHLTEDLADHAIEFIADLRHVSEDRPFLLYFAPGACHSPHQAPAEWIERYRGRFDAGWDAWRDATFARQLATGVMADHAEMSPRPGWVPAWDSLTADERRLYARYMECFAAYLSHADDQIGRVLDFLEATGDAANTVVMVISDNGASSEGGPTGSVNDIRPWNLAERNLAEALERFADIGGPWIHNNYPWGWTVAGNTPFRRWKREVHEGGVCDPLIVAWPAGIGGDVAGGIRRQYAHAVDLLPTILDLVGVDPPAAIGGVDQMPIDGVSLRPTFGRADAPEVRGTQYFEMFGSRAIYHEGWKAVTHVSMMDGETASDDDRWELFDVVADPSECHDLAASEPGRLDAMVELWWQEAERNQVLPVDSMPFFEAMARPPLTDRSRYVYWPGGGPVDEVACVNVRNRRHRITAHVDIPPGGASGVLLSQGSGHGGFVLMLLGGRLVYVHNFVALEWSRVESDIDVPAGAHRVGMRFEPGGRSGGVATLFIDDTDQGEVVIPRFTPTRWSICGDGLTCGYSMALPVIDEYRSPFRFTGVLERVVVDVDGERAVDPMAQAQQSLRGQ